MGILDNIGKGGAPKRTGKPPAGSKQAGRMKQRPQPGPGSASPAGAKPRTSGAAPSRPRPGAAKGMATAKGKGGALSRMPGKRSRKGAAASPRERIASAAAPLHDRRRRLVGAREATLRDLGGLMLEMYKRNRFREELLLDKCEEVLAIEVEVAHVDQRLFQLAPPNAAGMRPIGRCDCGAPIHPGQNFCGVCGRSFATLTQGRSCSRCGTGLRPGDQFCATCGNEAPDVLQSIEAPSGGSGPAAPPIEAATVAMAAVATPPIIDVPNIAASTPLDTSTPPLEPVAEAPAAHQNTTPAPSVDTPPIDPPPIDLPPETLSGEGAPAAAGDFDWTAPPATPDAAIDAALENLPPSPTDPETPFAGFPLTSTVPPPPIVDPAQAPAAAGASPQPATTEAQPPLTQPARTPKRGRSAKTSTSEPQPASPKAAAKAKAAAKKQRMKQAKARAKSRAKAARAERKHGSDHGGDDS